MRFLKCSVLLLLTSACGAPSPDASQLNIMGGSPLPVTPYVANAAFSSMVFLANTQGGGICGATKVGKFKYLTEGHCLASFPLWSKTLIRTTNGDNFPGFMVTRHDLHPSYSTTLGSGFDLGILTLEPTDNEGSTAQTILGMVTTDAIIPAVHVGVQEAIVIVGGGCIKLSGISCAQYDDPQINLRSMATETAPIDANWPEYSNYFRSLASSAHSPGPGDSGGPVFSASGSVIGVNAFIQFQSLGDPTQGLRTTYHTRLDQPAVTTWLQHALSNDWAMVDTVHQELCGNANFRFEFKEEERVTVLGTSPDAHTECEGTFVRGPLLDGIFSRVIRIDASCQATTPSGTTTMYETPFVLKYEWEVTQGKLKLSVCGA